MPPTELVKLTKSEEKLLEEIVQCRNKPLVELIPDDVEAGLVAKYAQAVNSMMERADSERAVHIAVLGRILFLARSRPDVLFEAKCSTVKAFEEKYILVGGEAGRTAIWRASASYETFPKITPQEVYEIGSTNLSTAIEVAKGKDLSPRQQKAVLEAAKTNRGRPEKFKDWIVDHGLAGKDELTGAAYSLNGSKAEIDELREHMADERFISFNGGDNKPIRLILAAIRNCISEWPTDMDEEMEEEEAPLVEVSEVVDAPMVTASAQDEEWDL